MKVHYKPKMVDKITNAIYGALEIGREVEFIELTDTEMVQFKSELRKLGPTMTRPVGLFVKEIEFMGVTVVKESPLRGYGLQEDF